jgi:heptosyltransferase-2
MEPVVATHASRAPAQSGGAAVPEPVRHPVAVIQPLPGIGDMVWHLPHIRAIAVFAGRPVTLIAKPRSLADQLLANDPAVGDTMWMDRNPDGRRGVHDGAGGFLRFVRDIRRRAFGTVIMLHHSTLIAGAVRLAGVPDRRGYGFGRQAMFLNQGPFLPKDVAKLHQHTRATRYLQAAGIPLPSAEPNVTVTLAERAESRRRLGDTTGRFVAVGIGSSEVLRQWGTERFAVLVRMLLDAGWPTVVLVGGPDDAAMAAAITGPLGDRAGRVRLALGWHLRTAGGLLAEAGFYIGNNTGPMNHAAATGTRTYALFGTTRPFHHASQIVPIVAPDIGIHDGMGRLTVDAAVAAIVADRGTLSP